MRLRTQRFFISLLAFLIAGIAVTNAYTFEVLNWSPFGVLNLEKLILKGSTTSTGIILDGTNYTIKIDPEHEQADKGQIRVYQICDENGNNCKNVANLGQGGGDGVQILDGQEGYICTKSGNNLVCNTTGTNSLNDFDFITGQDNRLCRKSGNKVVCNGRFGNGNLMIYGLNQNNPVSVIDGNGSISSIPLDGSGNYQVYIPYIPVVTGTDQYICVKSGGDMVCDKTTLGTMSNTKYCYYSGNAIHCTKDAPGNATITLQTKSGSTVTRSGSFQVNTTQNKTITIPSGGGGIPGQKGDPGDTGAYVTSAHIEGNNIIFVLSNGNEIELTDVIQTITGPQGEAGATGAIGATGATGNGIGGIGTNKVGGVTTVTITGTDGAIMATFTILDGENGNGSGISASGIPNRRCQYQCNGGHLDITWNCGTDFECSNIKAKYEDQLNCENPTENQECIQTAANAHYEHSERFLKYEYNDNGCSIVCDQQEPSCSGQCTGGSGDTIYSGIQVTQYTGGRYCKYMTPAAVAELRGMGEGTHRRDGLSITEGSGEIRCMFEGGGGGGSITISGSDTTKCCRYTSPNYLTCDAECSGGGSGGGGRDTFYYYNTFYNTGTYNLNQTGDIIYNNYYSGGEGESLWILTTNGVTTKSGYNVRFEDNKITYKTTLNFEGGSAVMNRHRTMSLDSKGARIGGIGSAAAFTGEGLGVVGAIGLGNFSAACSNDNRITMYTSGSSITGNFEILGSHRLLVGVGNPGGYIMFGGNHNAGINTTGIDYSTLTVNGSIDVGNCGTIKCQSNTAGQIRYVQNTDGTAYFIGCKKKYGQAAGTNNNAGYARVRLENDDVYTNSISNDSTCNDAHPYNGAGYQGLGLPAHGTC